MVRKCKSCEKLMVTGGRTTTNFDGKGIFFNGKLIYVVYCDGVLCARAFRGRL